MSSGSGFANSVSVGTFIELTTADTENLLGVGANVFFKHVKLHSAVSVTSKFLNDILFAPHERVFSLSEFYKS